jgi:hypothetical protein
MRGVRRLGWVAILGAAAVVPITFPLVLGYTLTWRDTARIHAPLRGLIVDALRELRLPLWNPYESAGIPLLAQMVHGVLHPVSVVAAFLVPRAGTDILIVAHVALATLGAALLARQLGATRGGAAAAGLGFGLSGYALSMSAVLHYLAAAGTAPWAIAALRIAGGRPLGVVVAALAMAALHFAGDPQWALVAVILGTALAIEHRGVRGLGGAAAGILLGTALAGIQLAPSWAYLSQSARGHMALTAAERAQWALAPWRLPELIAPGFFSGRPGLSLSAPVFATLGRSSVPMDPSEPTYATPFVASVCIGAVLLALAVAGAGASRRGRLLAALAVLLLWLTLGVHLGADQALHWVPIWGSFRYAEKLVGPFTLCIAILAGLGASRLECHTSRRVWRATTAATVAAVSLALWLGTGGGERLLRSATGIDTVGALAGSQLAIGVAHAAVGAAFLAILLAAAAHLPTVGRRFSVAAAVLVFLQALAAAPYAVHVGARDARESRPLAELTGTATVVRVATPLRGAAPDGHPGLSRSDLMLAVESRMGVTPYAAGTGIDQIDSYTALLPWQRILVDNALGWNREPSYWTAMRRYAISHVVVRTPRRSGEAARAAVAVDGGHRVLDVPAWGYSVWEVPHRPWATFAERVVAAQTPGEALRTLQGAVRGAGPDVVVEGWSPDGGFPPRLHAGRVVSVHRGTETVRIEADVAFPGVLVVNDAYWPGWTATLDGRAVPIMRADSLVRAVPWPARFRVLEMRYDPPEVRTGVWLTAAAAAVIAGLAILDRYQAGAWSTA